MHYKLVHPITCSPETADAELGRLITHAQRVWVHHLHVERPYLAQPATITVIEAPDGFYGIMERKVLPILVGKDGYEEIQPLKCRPEWTHRALLWPTPSAKPLDHTVLDGWSSAMLSLCWRPGRCAGSIWHAEANADRLDNLRKHGWTVIPLPTMAAQVIPRKLWTKAYAERPLLPATPVTASTDSAPSPAPITSTTPLPALAPTGELPQLSEVVADEDDDWGLPIGSMLTGEPVRLRWLSQTLSIAADPAHAAQATAALLGHALNTGMAVVAILPRIHDPATLFHDHRDRLLVIDPLDHWQSAALPWHKLSRTELAAALGASVDRLPDPLSTEFGALLEALGPAAPRPATLLSATASPGDDVLGVLRVGGAVILRVDDDEVSARLSTMLLLLAAKLEETPMVIIRPTNFTLPTGLAETVIEVVLADADQGDIAAHSLLTYDDQAEHWTLAFADGATPITLQANLTNVTPPLCDDERTLLVTTLQGPPDPRPLPQARAAEPVTMINELSPAALPAAPADEVQAESDLLPAAEPVAATDDLPVVAVAADNEVQAEPSPLPATEPNDVVHDDLAPLPQIEEPSEATYQRRCRRVAAPALEATLKHRRATATTTTLTDEIAPDARLPALDEPLPLPLLSMDEALPLPLPVLGQTDALPLPPLDVEPAENAHPLVDGYSDTHDQADALPVLADDPDLPPLDADLPTTLPALYALADEELWPNPDDLAQANERNSQADDDPDLPPLGTLSALQDEELWPNPDDLAPTEDQDDSQPDAVDRVAAPASLAWTLPIRQESPAHWPLSIPFDVED